MDLVIRSLTYSLVSHYKGLGIEGYLTVCSKGHVLQLLSCHALLKSCGKLTIIGFNHQWMIYVQILKHQPTLP